MRHRLSENYINRLIQFRNWEITFILIIGITAIVVLHQQYVRNATSISLILMAIVCLLVWKVFQITSRNTRIARSVWVNVEEDRLIYGMQYGEEIVYLKDLAAVHLKPLRWPELRLTFTDGRRLALQGFEETESIAVALKTKLKSN